MSGNLGDSVPDDGGEDYLPGLEPDEPTPPTESAQPIEPELTAGERIDRAIEEWKDDLEAAAESHRWSDKELDDWFENDFGGDDAFWGRFPRSPGMFPEDYEIGRYLGTGDLKDAVQAYEQLALDKIRLAEVANPWYHMGRDTKVAFRRGWEDAFGADPSKWSNGPATKHAQKPPDHYQAAEELNVKGKARAIGALSLSGGPEFEKTPAVPDSGLSVPRWVWLGGGLGVLGLVLVAGFFVFGGSDDPEPVADNDEPAATAVEEPAVAVEDEPVADLEDEAAVTIEDEPVTEEEDEAAVTVPDEPAVDVVADLAASASPAGWIFTATKTAAIVPAPEFIGATPIGAVLPWSVEVTESCNGDTCTYASTIRPLIPEVVIGEIPETMWMVDGAEWSLDVAWGSVQSSVSAETVCVIAKRWTYEFTVTEAELIEGRSIAAAFEGTWVQQDRLDLEASTGDLSLCGEPWELVDEWSVVGIAAG